MAERFTADLLFIIIALLIAALLGFLIGYFLEKGRCKKKCDILGEEIASLKARIRKLEEEKQTLQADVLRLGEEKQTLQSDILRIEEEKQTLHSNVRRMDDEIATLKLTIEKLEKESRLLAEQAALKAVEVPHAKVVADDLKVVIGIGPKIARLLMDRGITTWKALSETSPAAITEILLKEGGERYRIHNPETWPHQALLLHEGRWDELKELQGRLDGRLEV
jgi:predicted flap endonuclease-1-like 5' DNA nuclease